MDSTTVIIKPGSDTVRISSVYKRPGINLYRSDLDALTNYDGSFIIPGDLNSKNISWLFCQTNTSGRILRRRMEDENTYTICAPQSLTYFSYNTEPDILDIALVNLLRHQFSLINHNDLLSDHNSIIMHNSDSPITASPTISRKRVNCKKFEAAMVAQITTTGPALPLPLLTTLLCFPEGHRLFEESAKADIFADSMEKQFTNYPRCSLQENIDSIHKFEQTAMIATDFITFKEVWEIIIKLYLGIAPGCDIITTSALRRLPKIIIVLLAKIFTACLDTIISLELGKT